jgi:hypothetical protein
VESGVISDEELTRLALASVDEDYIADDAVPLSTYLQNEVTSLPEWYMAPITRGRLGRRGRLVVWGIVLAFLVIEAFGLCSTYGQPPFH